MKYVTQMGKGSRSVREWILVGAVVMCSASYLQAVSPPAGVAPVRLPHGGFGIDGNPMAGDPEVDVGDWLGSFQEVPSDYDGVLDAAGRPIDNMVTHYFSDPSAASKRDGVFTTGCKRFDDPNTWRWTTSSVSSKTDLRNAWLHVTTDAADDAWAIIGAGRDGVDGSAYVDFEFLQNPLEKNSDGSFSSEGPHGGRTVDDLLLSIQYVDGGKSPEINAYSWQPDGNGGYAYVDVSDMLETGRAFAAANPVMFAMPDGSGGQYVFEPNAFAEVAVDLSTLLGGVDACLVQSIQTIMVKTRASGDGDAAVKDFLDPIQHPVRVARAGVNQWRQAQSATTAFSLRGQVDGSLYPIVSTTWSVVDGDAVIQSPNSLNTTVWVSSISATVRLTTLLETGCVVTEEVLLTVVPPELEIGRLSATEAFVRWVIVPQQYQLQSAGDVAGSEWLPYNAPVVQQDGYNYVTVPLDPSAEYFRLFGDF